MDTIIALEQQAYQYIGHENDTIYTMCATNLYMVIVAFYYLAKHA